MKRRIKKFYVNHHPWFTNFTSSMCGTIIGIFITIGTTIYFQRSEQMDLVEKIKDFTLYNIQLNIEEIEYKLERMKPTNECLQYINSYFPNDFDKIPADSINSCLDQFSSYSFSVIDESPAAIFSSSIEIWKATSDTKLITTIGDCFAEIKTIMNITNNLDKQQMDIIYKYVQKVSTKKATLSPVEHIEELYSVPEFFVFALNYQNNYLLCKELLDELKEFYSDASTL